MNTLTKGQTYDLSTLTFTGWTAGDGTSTEGYNVADYFRGGVYLGADEHGIEPIVAEESEEDSEDAGPEGTRIANKLREQEEVRLDAQFGEPR